MTAEVVSASSDRVQVRFGNGKIEPIRFGQQTKFTFWGPGSPLVNGEPGPGWLKPGQKVLVSYVYRSHEATAHGIHIWIERKGCAHDEKWVAAGKSAASPPLADVPDLTGTTWEGKIAGGDGAEPVQTTTFEFLPGHGLAYQTRNLERGTNGHWRQNGASVLLEINDCYVLYQGTVAGDRIEGEFSNEMGARTLWTAHRQR